MCVLNRPTQIQLTVRKDDTNILNVLATYLSDDSKTCKLKVDVFPRTTLVRFTINGQLNTLWLLTQTIYNYSHITQMRIKYVNFLPHFLYTLAVMQHANFHKTVISSVQ